MGIGAIGITGAEVVSAGCWEQPVSANIATDKSRVRLTTLLNLQNP
jgi:hypothetical protein